MHYTRWPYWKKGGILGLLGMVIVLILLRLFGAVTPCTDGAAECLDTFTILLALPGFLVMKLVPFILDFAPQLIIPVVLLFWPLAFFGLGAGLGELYRRIRSYN